MRRAFANSLLSLLMLTTLVWGGCISCEQYFMWPGAESCCSPNGHCKTKKPASGSSRDCKQIAFDHQKPLDFHVDLPVVAATTTALPVVPALNTSEQWHGTSPAGPSPPDLQIIHSTFLI